MDRSCFPPLQEYMFVSSVHPYTPSSSRSGRSVVCRFLHLMGRHLLPCRSTVRRKLSLSVLPRLTATKAMRLPQNLSKSFLLTSSYLLLLLNFFCTDVKYTQYCRTY